MANNKNNNEKSVELLPEELRRKEAEKKEEKKPEISFYVPPEEKKPEAPKISFFEKIFGTKEEREKRRLARQKEKEEKEKKKVEKKALEIKEEKFRAPATEVKEKLAIPEISEKKEKPRARELKKIKKEAPPKLTLGITLIPEAEAPAYLPIKKQLAIVLVCILFASLLSLALYLILVFSQSNIKSQTEAVLKDIEVLKNEFASYEKDKTEAEKIQGRLEAIKNLLTSHLYWTKFFGLLEKNTIPDVYYTNFVAESGGTVALSAVGKSFTSVAEQLVAFSEAKDFVKEVNITGASAQVNPEGEVTAVNFEIDLKVLPEVLLK